jgi:hypothetical protein
MPTVGAVWSDDSDRKIKPMRATTQHLCFIVGKLVFFGLSANKNMGENEELQTKHRQIGNALEKP